MFLFYNEILKDCPDLSNFYFKKLNDYLVFINLNIAYLIGECWVFRDGTLLSQLFGGIDAKEKSYNEYLNETLFVFEGFETFYAIKEFFKSYSIHISGGGIPSRFAASTVQFNLFSFLTLAGIYPFF